MQWEEAKHYMAEGKAVRRADYAPGKSIAFIDTNYIMDGKIWWPLNEDAMAWDWELVENKKSAKAKRTTDIDKEGAHTVDTQEAEQFESSKAAYTAATLQNPLPVAGAEMKSVQDTVDPKIQEQRQESVEKTVALHEAKKMEQGPAGAE